MRTVNRTFYNVFAQGLSYWHYVLREVYVLSFNLWVLNHSVAAFVNGEGCGRAYFLSNTYKASLNTTYFGSSFSKKRSPFFARIVNFLKSMLLIFAKKHRCWKGSDYTYDLF